MFFPVQLIRGPQAPSNPASMILGLIPQTSREAPFPPDFFFPFPRPFTVLPPSDVGQLPRLAVSDQFSQLHDALEVFSHGLFCDVLDEEFPPRFFFCSLPNFLLFSTHFFFFSRHFGMTLPMA